MSAAPFPAARAVPSPIAVGKVTLRFDTPVLMGVLNATPDSFSDGGSLLTIDDAVRRAEEQVEAGATILDVGGESTRPGAAPVDSETEIARVLKVITAIDWHNFPVAISIDTAKADVARAALEHGATIVNDVTALRDPAMGPMVARHGAALVLMHMRGEPRTMQQGEVHYDDVVAEVHGHLASAVERAVAAGVGRERILVDPGIGFGKTLAHNLALTRGLGNLASLGRPVVYGPSRKRFLGELTGHEVGDRDRATAAACVAAVLAGAHVLRVHDVAAIRDAVLVATALRDVPLRGAS